MNRLPTRQAEPHRTMSTTQDFAPRGTVLLVDDEDLLRRLLSRMLAEAGFGVVEAENGAVALETARRLDGALGLVVTDIHMPLMNGLELAQALRPLHPTVPILFITGRDLPPAITPDVSESRLLRKPFRTEAFLGAVAELVSG
jgi:two-component system cell cycle sensor histidine kinase/response regulator CckA